MCDFNFLSVKCHLGGALHTHLQYASKKTLHTVVFSRREKNTGLTVLSPAFYQCISVPRQRWQCSKPAKTLFLQLALGLKAQLAPVAVVCMGQMYRASWPVKRW